MKNKARVISVALHALLLVVMCAGYSQAASANVTRVVSTVSPSQPSPGDRITVATSVFGSTGQPCYTNFTVTISGLPSQTTPRSYRIHSGQIARFSTVFTIPNPATGISSLTPTISWSGCGAGQSNALQGGQTPPVVVATPQPALSLTKALSGVGNTTVAPGDSITYRLTFQSTGSDPADNVVLTDTLAANLNFVSATGTYAVAGQTVTWNLGDQPPGSPQTVEVTAQVDPSAPNGIINNDATIDADSLSPVTSNTVSIQVDGDPNIALFKTVDDNTTTSAQREAGRKIEYKIRYENVGGGDASNLVISDVVPSEILDPITLVGGDSNNYAAGTRTATWTLNSVPKGAFGTVTLIGQIDPSLTAGDFDNTAQGTVAAPGTVGSATANIYTLAEPYFRIDKRVSPSVVSPGDDLSYAIEYRNIGSVTGTNPTITDRLPAGVTPVPGSYSAVYDAAARTLTWSLPDLLPDNQLHSLSYRVTVDPSTPNGTLINNAEMAADNLPGTLTTTAQSTTTVLGEPKLQPLKSLAPGSSSLLGDGQQVTFNLSVANTGTEATDGNVTLTDVLPAGLTFDSCTGNCTQIGQTVSWSLGDLTGGGLSAGGSSGTVSVTVTVDGSSLNDGDILSNAAHADAVDSAGRQYSETSAPVVLRYNLPAAVSLTKSSSPPDTTPLFPGQVIEYTLTAQLLTQTGADDLRLFDSLPANLEFVSASDPNVVTFNQPDGSTLIATPAADLTSGSRSLVIKARVASTAIPGDVVINRADASFSNGNRSAQASLTHTLGDAAIELIKSRAAGQADVIAGEEVTYTLTYTNIGRFPLTGITLRDSLPSDTTLVSATPTFDQILNGPPSALLWNLGSLDPGKSGTVVLKVQVDSGTTGVITNSAEITTNETQPKSAQVASTVREAPDLVLIKTTPRTTYHPGEDVEYTISFGNKGKGEAQNVVLEDTFPAGLTFVSATDNIQPVAGKLTWNLGTLPPGSSGSKIVRATVPAGSYDPVVTVTNQADIRSDKSRTAVGTLINLSDSASFTVTKAVDQFDASPGDTLHYTIDVKKNGDATSNAFVIDQLPQGLDYSTIQSDYPLVSGNANAALNADSANGYLVWTLPDFPAGFAPAVIHVSAQVASPLADGTQLINNASVVADQVIGSIQSNTVTTVVHSAPVLTISKSADTATVFSDPGAGTSDSVTYTITASNNGNAVATGVTITDTLPQELTIDPASTSGSVSGQTVTWTLPTLVPGNPQTLTVRARVDNGLSDGTILRNTAHIGTTMAGVGSASTNPVDITVQGAAVLTLSKAASRQSVKAGDELTYTLTYSNVGNAATAGDVVIEDLLPGNTSFVRASDNGSNGVNPQVVAWSLPPLAAGQQGSVTVTVHVADPITNGTQLVNQASAYVFGNSAISTTATSSTGPVTATSQPLFTMDKTASTGNFATVNGALSYTLDYTNIGSDSATNVTITDQLPTGFLLQGTSTPAVVNGNSLTWTLPSVAAKTGGVIVVSGIVDPNLADGDVLTNSATVISTETPSPVGDTATVTVQDARLTLTKTADTATAQAGVSATSTPGQVITYQLNYSNLGTAPASSITLIDQLPSDVTYLGAQPQPTSTASGVLTWDLGTLNAGQQGSVLVTAQTNDDLRDGLVLHNTASLSSATTPTINAVPVDIVVSSQPKLQLSKSSVVGNATPGQTVSWDITLNNIGSDTAENVLITDTLPANTSFVSASGGGVETSPGIVEWDIAALSGQLTANNSVAVSVKAVIDPPPIADGTQLTNTVTATAEYGASNALPPASATSVLSIISSPVLNITLDTDKPFALAGESVAYTVTISNTGTDTATGVEVASLLPSNVTPQVIDHGGAFVPSGTDTYALWTIGALPPAGSITLNFSVGVPIGTANGALELVLAGIEATNAPFTGAVALNVVGSNPALTLIKAAPNSVEAGDPMTYRLDYFNSGNGTASAVVIEDLLPPGVTFTSATNGGTEVSPGVVQWNIGNVDPLSGGNVQVTVATAPGITNGTQIGNIASISASNGGGRVANAITIERSHTELIVTNAATAPTVAAGDDQTFTVSWANTGNQDTTGTVVTATIPPNTTFASATAGGGLVGGVVEWTVGNLAAGANSSATFTVTTDSPLIDGTTLKSVAEITADLGQPNSETATFAISSSPIWVLAKTTPMTDVDTGSQVSFEIDLQNLGNADATGVVVTDTLPAGLQVVSASAGGVIDRNANTITWNPGTVAASSGPVDLSLVARVIGANSTLTNRVTIASNEIADVTSTASVTSGAPRPVNATPAHAWLLLALGLIILGAQQVRRRRFR